MGTWNRVGISPYRVEDLAPESREHLSASRSPEAVAPILLDPNSLDDLTSFLLDLESPRHNDPRYVKFRNVLLSSIWVYETTDGNRVAVLSEPVERFVRERISTIKDEDRGDLLALESELNRAIQTLSEDGRMARSAHSVTSICGHAAHATESFLANPRRTRRLDLEDFLQSIDGVYALAGCVELLRRLLLAAGRSCDALGAATIGHHDFEGIDDAIFHWKVADGRAAYYLAEALVRLMSRTRGLENNPFPLLEPHSASWIEECSLVGQTVLRWVYGRGEATTNFATTVGAAWPGPALYGYDDGEEEPEAAHKLCSALESGMDPEIPLLCGTYETSVSREAIVPIPEKLLEGADHLYVAKSAEEPGALLCQVPSRRFAKLARLISDEQELKGYPWALADEFEREFALYATGEKVAIVDGGLPLREVKVCGWAKPGMSITLLGLGDHFEIANTERHAAFEKEHGIELSELLQTYYQE